MTTSRVIRWLAVTAVALCVALPGVARAGTPADCGQRGCAIVIEVAGLEPEDVTQTGTPFLWAMAHASEAPNSSVLQGRNGFMWQAARSPMTASTATSAASLLTAANPEQHGILADEYLDGPTAMRLMTSQEALAEATLENPITLDPERAPTMFELVPDQAETAQEPVSAAIIGDPAVAQMLTAGLGQIDDAQLWYPGEPQQGNRALCGAPRLLPTVGSEVATDMELEAQRVCPASDLQTLEEAAQRLTPSTTQSPVFTYIHLAELGRTKQLHGDPETEDPQPTGDEDDTPVKAALANLDAAIAEFVERYANHPSTQGVFDKTIFFIVGNHGYEETPIDRRVPDPEHPDDPTLDFSDWVLRDSAGANSVRLVPQGTIGTVYAPTLGPADLDALATKIEDTGNDACDCIDAVAPTATLAQLHRTWYLDPLEGDGGQLVVTLKPGWGFGRAVPSAPDPSVEEDPRPATNPWLASAGGPRNRAVAMFVNGPSSTELTSNVVALPDGQPYMAVKPAAENPANCGTGDGVSFTTANDPDTMADDAAAPGHECQPETVDVALSVAAMLGVPVGVEQLPAQGRFLNEAFNPDLKFEEEVVDVEEPEPEPDPPAPIPPVIIRESAVSVVPPPPPKESFTFRGLVRRLRARVVDARGRTFRAAKRGTAMSAVEVRADFGRPESLVTITFYRPGRKATGGRAKRLVSIAKFKPFPVKRGPAKLRLKIPRQFRPTHIGVTVQEVRTIRTVKGDDGRTRTVKQPIGSKTGGIATIADARHLHSRKGGSRGRTR